MKRLTRFLAFALVMVVSTAPAAFGDDLLPIDPNGPYGDAWGIATTSYTSTWTDWLGERVKARSVWTDAYFEGLVPNGHYMLICYSLTGGERMRHDFLARGNGTADGSFGTLWVKRSRIDYFVRWTAESALSGIAHPVDPVLRSD